MEQILLSLKNIYKMLMTDDFPVYSKSVISAKNRKGLTILKFWENQLVDELRSLPVGKMIWRNDGKRNRYISNLCNRSLDQRLCVEYAGELSQKINSVVLLNQTERFMSFLSARAYLHDVLFLRISELLFICEKNDRCVSGQLVQRILRNMKAGRDNDEPDNLFRAGYLLTVLTIYAAAGDAMDDPRLSVLQEDSCCMERLWGQYRRRKAVGADKVTFLSIHAGILQDNPLPPHRFYGREEELFDLREMAVSNRKCLISGMGGVGKTELLRQLLRVCKEEKRMNYIAVIPYDIGIVESFLRAFPDYPRHNAEETFQMILRMLEKKIQDGSSLLVLIDNMTSSLEDDPALTQLLSLSCSILITSRHTELHGFEVYYIREPAISTGSLIFRDNYGKPLSPEDRTALHSLMKEPYACHPLTLRMLARASAVNSWSVQQMAEQLRKDITALTWMEGDQSFRLDRIYRQLYSLTMLSDHCREVADLFTLLPRCSYSSVFLERYFPYLSGNLQKKLDILETEGWLEADEYGYSMHPLIAQCLRRKIITEDRIARQIEAVRCNLAGASHDLAAQNNKDIIQIGEILIHISEMISGSISPKLMLDIMDAFGLMVLTRESVSHYKRHLDQLMKRCQVDDLLEVAYYTLLSRWECGDPGKILEIYRKQKRKLTIPMLRYLDLCVFAGGSLLFHQNTEIANEMCKEAIRDEATPVQKATAYYHLAVQYDITGDAEQALYWGETGVAYIEDHPECGKDLIFVMLVTLATSYVKFGRKEAARQLIEKIDGDNLTLPLQRIAYGELLGNYELYFGSLEKALTHFECQTSLHLEYCGADRNYYAALGQIAIVRMRLKDYTGAADLFKRVIPYAREAGETFLFTISCNNLAVLYLEMEQPEDALPLLQKTFPEAREKGGIALGECLKNFARAYGQMHEFTKELECLREAVPLLEAAYGPEHPRSQAASQRLTKLEEFDTL